MDTTTTCLSYATSPSLSKKKMLTLRGVVGREQEKSCLDKGVLEPQSRSAAPNPHSRSRVGSWASAAMP